MKVIHRESFYHDGRGPELVAVHLAPHSAHLLAIDYRLPDSQGDINHLSFKKTQVYMVTPEEVENYATSSFDWSNSSRGAIISLGYSPWQKSFSPRHLEKCEHFRIMFYDEFFDVICEDVEINHGAYISNKL